ncbi:DNA repair protein RecN [Lacticaseibacillus parakribbianus]|uniref:DNA repair protein RecN n=1 Tax=Lacticaseibacillus parakribbianus TaxID=2970927 RepID=UPI0021CB4D8E|nr:DNA repair protein RecN [Lacticaseibacillus parakribbianus]
MLQELVIHDFAIIDKLELSFQTGMTALTGETGAGKSIIIDAVSLLAGGRGSTDFVRTGAAKATLQGLFDATSNPRTASVMAAFGLAPDDGTVLLSRDLYASGRNLCRVNGELVNTATLRAIGETLVDIHGQNEHQQLIHPESHLGLLDQFAGDPVARLLTAYKAAYATYQKDRAALSRKQQNEREWAQRLDMLRFQVNEITTAALAPDEENQLTQERDRLANYQRIADALNDAYALLSNEEQNPLDQVATAMTDMQGIAKLDEGFAAISQSIESAYYALQDAQGDLSRQLDQLEWDEGRLDAVEKRLDLIAQLERKYGATVEAVIAYGQKAAKELATMEATEADAEGLDQRVAAERAALVQAAAKLTTARQAAAKRLIVAIHQQLAALYMAKTVFEVHIEPATTLRDDGLDQVEFYIQTNPGESAKPLAKIASGGELSRIMLALKTIFAETDGVTSIIFDEVDTGVSGRVAQAIANKISQIATHSQVLCISHLPQVAAMSDHEYVIQKAVHGGRTNTTVQKLDHAARVQEIARMLAGESVTHLAVEHAEELLAMAAETKATLRKQR